VEGPTMVLQRTPGDLANWRLGRLKDELDSWGVRYLQAAQEQMSELDSLAALQGGVAREGWLHYHVQNVTPTEITNGSFELSVKDSRGRTHIGSAKGRIKSRGAFGLFGRRAGASQLVLKTRPKAKILRLVPALEGPGFSCTGMAGEHRLVASAFGSLGGWCSPGNV